jgi:hypothetical protein
LDSEKTSKHLHFIEKQEKRSSILKKVIIFVCICTVVVFGCVLYFNKTFIHDYYEVTNDQGEPARFTALQFSFFAGEPEKHTAVFYRFGNQQDMQNKLNHYVESLTSCYDDGAFCDTEQDITIYSYQVSDGFLLHKITLIYDTIDLKESENSTGIDIQTLVLDGTDYRLQQGDSYVASEWTRTPEYRLNQTTYVKPAVTGRGVTTGDSLDKVVSSYNIKSGYALWDVELNTHNDGTLIMESRKYGTGEFDESNVQMATLIFGFYRLETQWIPLTYEEINQYIAFLSGETSEKPYDGILMYQFQFPFNRYSQLVPDKTVASFFVDFAGE